MDGFNLTNFIGLGDVQLLHLWLLLFNSAPYSLVELFVGQLRPYNATMKEQYVKPQLTLAAE